MDLMNRGGQARTNNPLPNNAGGNVPSAAPSASGGNRSGNSPDKHSKLVRIGFLSLLFGGTILAVAALLFLAFGKGVYKERQFVDRGQLQAVFINVNGTNGGQVYFGNITDMTSQYIRLTNVFYIQNQQAGEGQSNSSYNLVKLGCELHGPQDAMLINRGEVFFWENLKSDSQVAQKVAEFHKQNPNGQKCNAAAPQGQQPGASTQTPATTPAPAVTPNGTNTQNNTQNNAPATTNRDN